MTQQTKRPTYDELVEAIVEHLIERHYRATDEHLDFGLACMMVGDNAPEWGNAGPIRHLLMMLRARY